MLVLLPPAETKRPGGDGEPLRLEALSWRRALGAARRTALDAVTALAADEDASRRALHLGPRQAGEVRKNREIALAPTMPALQRYDGVLYRALGAGSLDAAARRYAAAHLAIHSALFGLVGADDPIPDHRLSCTARVPGLNLRALWAAPITAVLADRPGVILDLRSTGYRRLGPLPAGADAAAVSVEGSDGRVAGHSGKRLKGIFIAALLADRPKIADVPAAIDWARSAGFTMARRTDGLHLRPRTEG